MFQVTFWSVPPLLVALVCVGSYLQIRSKKRIPGIPAILALLAAVLFWSGAQFMDSLFVELAPKVIATKLSYFGIVLTPVAWLTFAITYTRRQMRLSRTALNLICIIPLITVALVVTNEWHGLVWRDLYLLHSEFVVGLITQPGPWFYVHALYSYGLLIVATTILAWAISQTKGEWKPVVAVISAPLVAGLANVFSLSPLNPIPWFDMTTLGFAAAAIILNAGLLRHGLLDRIPVVRDRVVEQLSDGVMVINRAGMIVDINTSALEILGTTRSAASNAPIMEFVTTYPLAELMRHGNTERNSLEITLNSRAYDVSASLLDTTDPDADLVLVLRDVTDRRKTEQDLRSVQDELVRLAHTDYLTGIHNRRFFMQRLQEEVERVRRHGGNLSVLLFDLDLFKRVNDVCGHNTGDQILKLVADVTMDIKRVTDVAARVGGEEFALLLPETDQAGAVHLAQRLRQAISQIHTATTEAHDIEVTASIGVATVGIRSRDLDNVLNHADEALYKAKNSGRNAVCCADISAGPADPD